jgi:hypothetical protein
MEVECHLLQHLVFHNRTNIHKEALHNHSTTKHNISHQTPAMNPNGDSQVKVSNACRFYATYVHTDLLSDASDAMITNLSISTHPGLNISKHLRMNLPPSPTMTQQSVTINLPPSYYYLQIKPTIAASLRERQYKLFVTSGTQRLHAMPLVPGNAVDNLHPLFEARILPGVNRIEIELIAALPKGAPKLPNGQDVELEKITIFANLMKS